MPMLSRLLFVIPLGLVACDGDVTDVADPDAAVGPDARTSVGDADVPDAFDRPDGVTLDADVPPQPEAGPRDGGSETGRHAHYLFLSSQPELLLKRPYSSADGDSPRMLEATIDDDAAGRDPSRWNYDSGLDAALQVITSGGFTNLAHSETLPAQNRGNSRNAFIFYQVYFSASATRIKEASNPGGDGGGIYRTFKTWVARNESKSGGTDPRGLEIRLNGFQNQTAPDLAFIDFRTYGDSSWSPADNGIEGTNEFVVRAGVFTSYWLYVDWETNRWSVWAADSDRPESVRVMDQFQMDDIGAIDPFIIQFNSSQNGGNFPEPVEVGVRNFVYLRDLPSGHADAVALIGDPSAREY
ncbi:MAG: hypothetical protein AAGF12_28645 [Myxococcota bacterium]